MARKQLYIVEVVFTSQCPNCAIGIKHSGYLKGGNNMDTFEFKKNGFTIKAERSTTYADGKILSSDRNGLYGQIMKGLLVYYALSSNFPKIKKISIVRKRKRFSDIAYSETTDFKQPLNPRKNRTLTFSSQNIDEILNETPKGYAIRTAMTYWLKALNSSDVYFRFDRYWKAYDRLLLYEGNTKNQKDAIIAIKRKISEKEEVFTKSKELINTTYDDDYIKSFSWNNLLYNKSNKYKNVDEIKRRAIEYTDSRAIRLYKHLLGGDKINAVLVERGERNNIDTHFSANAETKKDIDIVLLMSLSYTYYVRCRMFHGEIPDSTFKLKRTNEDYEIEELVKLLELVTFELLDNNNILR